MLKYTTITPQNYSTISLSLTLFSIVAYQRMEHIGASFPRNDNWADSRRSRQVNVLNGTYLFVGTSKGGIWKRLLTDIVSLAGVRETVIPQRYSLFQNYPNPFNPLTVIGYQ